MKRDKNIAPAVARHASITEAMTIMIISLFIVSPPIPYDEIYD